MPGVCKKIQELGLNGRRNVPMRGIFCARSNVQAISVQKCGKVVKRAEMLSNVPASMPGSAGSVGKSA